MSGHQVMQFVFPNETDHLSDAAADSCALAISRMRRAQAIARTLPRLYVNPPMWDPTSSFHAEHDGRATGPATSFRLLCEGGRAVWSRLRLYSQAFSGYQLAFMRFAESRYPWIRAPLGAEYDAVLPMLVSPNLDEHAQRCLDLRNMTADFFTLPPAFGEMGWELGDTGIIMNHDTWMYAARLQQLRSTGLLDRLLGSHPCVVEIGGGFGGLGYMVQKFMRNAVRYVIVDLPESLAFSAMYLDALFPDLDNRTYVDRVDEICVPMTPGFSFVPHYNLDALRFGEARRDSCDLALNTLSFAEMHEEQVSHYGAWLARNMRHGLLFEANNHFFHGDEKGERLPVLLSNAGLKHVGTWAAGHPSLDPLGQARIWGTP